MGATDRDIKKESRLTTMIEIIQELSQLHSLAGEWNALADQVKSPLLRHEWFLTCAEALCGACQLSVMLLRSHGEIRAIAPLGLEHRFGEQRLVLLGTDTLCEPSGLIYSDQESLKQLIKAISDRRITLVLKKLAAESPEAHLLKSQCEGQGSFTFTHSSASPWIPITTSWDEFERSMSPSRRSSLRRAQRRAEQLGKVRFEIIAPTPESVDQSLSDVFRVEASGWKRKMGTAMTFHHGLGEFFRTYARRSACLGMLRLCFMKIDDTIVSVQLAVEHGRRFWILKIGYDESRSACSPGTLLMHESIRYAFENKLEAFEFLGKDEPWIQIWTQYHHNYETQYSYPISLQGLVGLGKEASRIALKRMRSYTLNRKKPCETLSKQPENGHSIASPQAIPSGRM